MELYNSLPIPSDRMGMLWTIGTIQDAFIIEFGTAGTTHFTIKTLMQKNAGSMAHLYTTGLDESDITLGSHKKLKNAIREVDKIHSPDFIFVMASSVTAVIGMDIESICFMLQKKTTAKLIPITTGGFQGDLNLGVRNALKLLCTEVVQPSSQSIKGTYNIIGSQIDSLNFDDDAREIKSIMEKKVGYSCHTFFTSNTSIDEIKQASRAEFNIVIRPEGIDGAKVLEERFGQPYIEGTPDNFKDTIWLKTKIQK